MNRIAELQDLRARTLALEKRLLRLQGRLRGLQEKPRGSAFKAVVDPERCIRCGRCTEVCPVGALSLNGAARVDAARCIGCGRCRDECPAAAISLRPAAAEGDLRRRPGNRGREKPYPGGLRNPAREGVPGDLTRGSVF